MFLQIQRKGNIGTIAQKLQKIVRDAVEVNIGSIFIA